MADPISLIHQSQWIAEATTYRFAPITLYDEAHVALPAVTTLTLSLVDLAGAGPPYAIVNGVDRISIKTGRGSFISGVLTLTLTPEDTALVVPTRTHEMRLALIEYTWGPGGLKSDCLELTFVVRNVGRRGDTAVSTLRVMDTATVTLVS